MMTEQQRKALHLWFRQVAEALNEKVDLYRRK